MGIQDAGLAGENRLTWVGIYRGTSNWLSWQLGLLVANYRVKVLTADLLF